MAIIPKKITLDGNSAQIINAIKNTDPATFTFDRATYDINSINAVGTIIMGDTIMRNKFISTLINRIAKTVLTTMSYENPWKSLKRGMLENGEVVEEIAFQLCDVHTYDTTEDTEFPKQEVPELETAFHKLNYSKYYKRTVNHAKLRQAFITLDGVSELVTEIINTMYTTAEYDEFLVMKYLIGRTALNNFFSPVTIPAVNAENMKEIASRIKAISNELTFMRTTYNPFHLPTNTRKENQIVIVNSNFDAYLDVEVLAFAFNMEKADFSGNRIMIDSFNKEEVDRMTQLLGENLDYEPFTDADIEKLNSIPAFIIDNRFFMIFDYLLETSDFYNGEKLYWNYWLHTWKVISNSPFVNAVMLTSAENSIESVEIAPDIVTVMKGQSVQFTADVAGTGFYNKNVNWEISDADAGTINGDGLLKTNAESVLDEVTVQAVSVSDSSKIATAVVTLI